MSTGIWTYSTPVSYTVFPKRFNNWAKLADTDSMHLTKIYLHRAIIYNIISTLVTAVGIAARQQSATRGVTSVEFPVPRRIVCWVILFLDAIHQFCGLGRNKTWLLYILFVYEPMSSRLVLSGLANKIETIHWLIIACKIARPARLPANIYAKYRDIGRQASTPN